MKTVIICILFVDCNDNNFQYPLPQSLLVLNDDSISGIIIYFTSDQSIFQFFQSIMNVNLICIYFNNFSFSILTLHNISIQL